MLTLENISIDHSRSPLTDVSYEFEAGKFYCILGRTGAGKTEILRTLMGLEELTAGRIMLDGDNMSKRPIWDRNMALVYQQFINYPHLSVLDNVAFPLRRQKMAKRLVAAKAAEMLAVMGISEMAMRRPSQLSGGQQQRVALARALVKDARILMLDEPLVNLDYKLREQLREDFPKLLHNSTDSVILYTTTEPQEAMQLADELLIIDGGRIVGAGAPADLFERPKNIAVARVISDPPIAFVQGQIKAGRLECRDGTILPSDHLVLPTADKVTIAIRPDALSMGDEFRARVVLSEINGSETIVHLQFSFGEAVMLLDGVTLFEVDDEIGVNMDAQHLMLFSKDGHNITKRAA